jgi:hypothetical protein
MSAAPGSGITRLRLKQIPLLFPVRQTFLRQRQIVAKKAPALPLDGLANCLSEETPAILPTLARAKKAIGLRGRHWRGAAFDAAARAGANPEKEPKSV